MDTTRAEQIALDDTLVAPAKRLKTGKINLRLSSDLKSKEATLQVVYDVLKLTPFYKAFQIAEDVPDIYIQEFWVTTTVHHHSICFKMNNKKHIVNLEYFREMLQICTKLPNQQFEELPFEEAILTFLRDLGHSGEIKMITDVNVNKLHQPWRSFFKEDFVYQVENKNVKRSNEMYYPRFTKVIINFFMTKDQSIPRRNKAAKTAKKKQPAKTSKAKGLTVLSEKSSDEEDNDEVAVNDDDDNDDADNQNDDGQEYDEHDDEEQGDDNEQTDSDNDGDDFVHPKFSTHDEEDKEKDSFDPQVQTPSHVESTDDEDSDEEIQDVNVEGDKMNEEETNEEVEVDALYKDVNVNLEGRDTEMTDALRTIVQTTQVIEDTHVIITPVNPEGQQQSSSMSSGFVSNMLNPSPDTKSTSLVDVPITTIAEPPLIKTLENNFSEFNQTNQFAAAVSSIPGIIDAYLANKMHEAVKTVDQVKEQVKAQVSKILPKIEKTVNEQLKAEVQTRSSNKSTTSHVVVTNLSKLELKKILIDNMESNMSIHRSDEPKNFYKALVDAYESDKLILDTYGETVSFKRRRDKEDQDEAPFAGSNRGSKRRRAGKEPESTKTSQLLDWFQKPEKPPTPDDDWNKTLPDDHGPVQPWLSSLAQIEDPRELFNELMDTPLDFSAFVMNWLKVDTLTPELLVGPTFKLMKGSCKSLVKLEYFFEDVYKATTNQLDWNNPEVYLSGGVSSHTYTTSVMKTKAADYGNIKWIEDLGRKQKQFYGFTANMESARDVYSKCRIIAIIKPQIVKWHNYKHLDWITVCRDDDNLYTFKEGDFNRLRIQDIEDMLLLLVQGKLTNLTIEEHLAFNVSLRMFTRSVVIQRRVEDLQLGVESYQKKLNLIKLDMYRSDLKRKEAYSAYSNPRGFVY
ncbi:hypothetical protein Tco_0251724 [Tanacetum coccineum]